MSWKLIEFDVLKQVVAGQSRVFVTKDVSEDERMRQAHPELANHSLYHAFVGASLSKRREALGISKIREAASRGARWEKHGCTEPAIASAGQENFLGLGPQHRADSQFVARMRLHQSWYRCNVLRVPYGTGPKPNATTRYGNMLARPDAEAGRNFLTPEIAQVARDRVAQGGDHVEPFRLFHNMLSSQPMCFNLFGPLVKNCTLARQLLSPLVPEGVAEVTRVAIEWAPEPKGNYLDDGTSFDAFIEYRTSDGQLCGLGVETKLTEPFSPKEYDGEGYRRWMRVLDSPWRPDADGSVHAIQHNQLWRDHLLTVALRHQPNSSYASTRLMVVRHPEDNDCSNVLAGYRKLLRDKDDSLIDMPLDRLVDAWAAVLADAPQRDWMQDVRVRYLELERSASCAD